MKEKIKILVVEDESLIAENLKISLHSLGYNVIGIADNALDAVDFLMSNNVDFAILDINIKGEKTGIWLAEYLQKKHNIPFIFLTAYSDSDTLSEALKTKPNGYLVKPFIKENIATTIEVALNNYTDKSLSNTTINQPETKHDKILVNDKTNFFVKDKNTYFKVNFNDILFLEAENNYVNIITNNKKFLIRNSLSKIAAELPSNFVKVHRSFYINKHNIDRIEANIVHIKNYKIPVSNSYKQDLLDSINKLM